jgi:hypothetical protein
MANSAKAADTITVTLATGGFGLLSAAGGTIVAIPSCATVPVTFWVMGGTGWTCAGGVVAAVGGIGALVMSGVVGLQAYGDKVEADRTYQAADREARDLFQSLKAYAGP